MRLLRAYPLLSFSILAYAIASLLALPLALSNRGLIAIHVAPEWEVGVAFGPFIAAVLVLRASNDRAAVRALWLSFKRWRIGRVGWLLAAGSPWAFLVVAFVGIAIVQQALPRPMLQGWTWVSMLRTTLDLVIVASLLQSIGEEPGWRGFLLPKLRERYGPLAATFVLFPIWLFWHLPMVLARPEFSVAQFAGFSLGILSAAIWLTVIYEYTHSLLAAIVWHALVNLTRGLALALSTNAFLAYGLAVSVGAVGVALILWRHDGQNGRHPGEPPDS